MAKRNLDIHLGAKDDTAQGFRSAGKRVDEFAKKSQRSFRMAGGAGFASVGGLVTGIAGGAFVRQSVDAWIGQEKSMQSVSDALETMGKNSAGARARASQLASELQNTANVADDVALTMQTMGINIGKLTGTQLERATKAAVGLSRALNMDTQAAMMLVSRASVGQTQTLSRYGIVLDQTLSKQDQFNQLLGMGEAHFNTFTDRAKTAGEELQQIKLQMGDLLEISGKLFVEGASRSGAAGAMGWLNDILRTGESIEAAMAKDEEQARMLADIRARRRDPEGFARRERIQELLADPRVTDSLKDELRQLDKIEDKERNRLDAVDRLTMLRQELASLQTDTDDAHQRSLDLEIAKVDRLIQFRKQERIDAALEEFFKDVEKEQKQERRRPANMPEPISGSLIQGVTRDTAVEAQQKQLQQAAEAERARKQDNTAVRSLLQQSVNFQRELNQWLFRNNQSVGLL